MSAKTARAAAGMFPALVVLVLAISSCTLTAPGGGSAAATLGITMKQPTAPIASIAVTVTASGMAPIAETVSVGQTEIVLEVPAGPARTFRVLVNTASVTFMDETTVDLAAGEKVTVTLQPVLSATQIIVPDANNGRLVQISDMDGTGWVDVYDTDIGYDSGGGPFTPYDIDFDADGRIYIANNPEWSEGAPVVLRLDDINDSTYETIVRADELPSYSYSFGVPAIAVDRANGYLYYVEQDAYSLCRKKLGSPLGPKEEFGVDMTDGMSTRGLAVGPSGHVYIVIDSGGYPEHSVLKVDVMNLIDGTAPVPASYGYPEPPNPLNQPWDVIVKPPYVYVANANTADWSEAYSIVQLTQDLEFVRGFGAPWYGPPDPVVGEFYGPRRFLAALNPGFTLIDEYAQSEDRDRLVFLGDMVGAGWKTFGSTGSEAGQFTFFEVVPQ